MNHLFDVLTRLKMSARQDQIMIIQELIEKCKRYVDAYSRIEDDHRYKCESILKLRATIEQQQDQIERQACLIDKLEWQNKGVDEWRTIASTAIYDNRELRSRIKELEKAIAEAKNHIHGAKLCEINSMSSRHEMLRLMDQAIAALEQKESVE